MNRLLISAVLLSTTIGTARAEDLPEEKNRVVLDPVLKDADGIPAPKLLYRMSENSKRLSFLKETPKRKRSSCWTRSSPRQEDTTLPINRLYFIF